MRLILPTLMCLALTGFARAQDGDARRQAAEEQFANLPPEVQLGARAEVVRRQWPVARVVVVVQQDDDALEAIARWTVEGRYPVLIDDGTDAARERIGMFVRAFAPERVVRWSPSEQLLTGDASERLEAARERVWGVSEGEDLAARYASINFVPPGAVVMTERDPAWLGGAALAIGRGQVAIWASPVRGRIGSVMDEEALAAFNADITNGLEASGRPWRDLGDELDALTLCLSAPSRLDSPDGQGHVALTDRIGRHDDGSRYAWASMIPGSAPESLYMAMCSLFLQPERAWLFNGYNKGAGFDRYDVQAGAAVLNEVGIETLVDDGDAGTVDSWRARAASGVTAGLIHVNSMGNSWFFASRDGRLVASDVPMLARPAIVHFIHSYSAQNLNLPSTIGSAWLRRGAYAYAGSVHEPYLTAFHTPESLVGRMLAPAPWAAAARQDVGKVWKINLFGDALLTLGPPAPRADAPVHTSEGVLLEKELGEAMSQRRFDDAAWTLSLLGRDGDLVRLAQAVAGDLDATLTPGVARCALPAAVRTGQRDAILDLWEALPAELMDDPDVADWLWLGLRPTLATTTDARAVTALRGTLTEFTVADDVIAVALAGERLIGKESGRAILEESAERARRPNDKRRMESALRRMR